MRPYPDCIPCLLRHALHAGRAASPSKDVHDRVVRAALRETLAWGMKSPAPVMGQRIQRIVRRLSRDRDPYRRAKQRSNRLALRMLPSLRRRVARAKDPLEAAVRFAVAGNIIDLGSGKKLPDSLVRSVVGRALAVPLKGSVGALRRAAAKARKILYIADNAGEIVLDRLLIERLPMEKITVSVRGMPVINDATIGDARAAGLTDIVEVIDNGSDAPGIVLKECSKTFKRRFAEADLIIAKGQGNFETVGEHDKHAFFILMAKCKAIARHTKSELGSLLLVEHKPRRRRRRR